MYRERNEETCPFLEEESNLDSFDFLEFETERPEDLIRDLQLHVNHRININAERKDLHS